MDMKPDITTSSHDPSVAKPEVKSATAHLVSYVLLNAAFVFLVATCHSYSEGAIWTSDSGPMGEIRWVWAWSQSILIFAPSLAIYWGLRPWFPKLSRRLAVAAVLLSSGLYLVDLALILTIREHLISNVFINLLQSIIRFIHLYIEWWQWGAAIGGVVVWLGFQRLLWIFSERKSTLAGWLGYRGSIIASVSLACFGALVCWSTEWQSVRADMVLACERHPLTSWGGFPANGTPAFESQSFDAVRGTTWLLHRHLKQQDTIEVVAQRIRASFPKDKTLLSTRDRPDVLVVLTECLRPDVITPKTTPNLHAWSQDGLRFRQHYSSGNWSCLGFFGLLYGVDSFWYQNATDLPMGLVDGLENLGYRTGIFARTDLSQMEMNKFCNLEYFDVADFGDVEEGSLESDRLSCHNVAKFFARQEPYTMERDKPRFAFLYLYAPHNRLSEPVDRIHRDSDLMDPASDAPPFKWIEHQRRNREKFVKFLDSVHFVDRVIAPLLSEDRIVIVTGDHGESFGEDHRFMHGSALSEIQIRVAGMINGPGVPHREVFQPTNHLDFWPTIFELVTGQQIDEEVAFGTSLVRGPPGGRMISVGEWKTDRILVVKPDRALDDPVLGYQGFFNLSRSILAPGGRVDTFANLYSNAPYPLAPPTNNFHGTDVSPTSGTSFADVPWFLDHLEDRFGHELASIPSDPVPMLRKLLQDDDIVIRVRALAMTRHLGRRGIACLDVLRDSLDHPSLLIRDESFRLIQSLERWKVTSQEEKVLDRQRRQRSFIEESFDPR